MPERLGSAADLVAKATLVVSSVSIWELAVKQSLGKVDLGSAVDAWFIGARRELDLSVLEISASHAAAVESLPWHHRDPFDRMLVAQSRQERVPLLTADRTLSEYDADVQLLDS